MPDYRKCLKTTEQIIEEVLTSDPMSINDRNRLLAKVWSVETGKPFETFLKFLLEHSNAHSVFRAAEKYKADHAILKMQAKSSEVEEKKIMTGEIPLISNLDSFTSGREELQKIRNQLRNKNFINGLEEDKEELHD